MTRVGVLGAGSWGTAIAVLLSQNHADIRLWEFSREAAASLLKYRENRAMLPGITIPDAICVTGDLDEAVADCDILIGAVPSHAVRSLATRLAAFDLSRTVVVGASKGIENESLLRMSQIYLEVIPALSADRFVAMSGPSHAEEVSRQIPTTVVAACSDHQTARWVQEIFMTPAFRVYSHSDVTGVEVGGALKNVIAIAAGIVDGVRFGDNTKAALMTRGLAEMTRLGTAMGAEPATFAGLSGIGDMIVTCMSRHSRNRHVGEEIGRGKGLQAVLDEMVMVAEGVKTTKSVNSLAQHHNIEMPISSAVFEVLFQEKNAKQAVYELMARGAKQEDFGS